MHSGELTARFSMKSMLIKKWKPVFWIAYGKSQLKLLFFRNKADFEEWVSNPLLKIKDQNDLIKFVIDFKNDVKANGGSGLKGSTLLRYAPTPIKTKGYSNEGYMHHFKLEGWHMYGPSIMAAFGSKNDYEVNALRRIVMEMVQLAGYAETNQPVNYDSDASGSSIGYASSSGYISGSNSAYDDAGYNSAHSARSAPDMYRQQQVQGQGQGQNYGHEHGQEHDSSRSFGGSSRKLGKSFGGGSGGIGSFSFRGGRKNGGGGGSGGRGWSRDDSIHSSESGSYQQYQQQQYQQQRGAKGSNWKNKMKAMIPVGGDGPKKNDAQNVNTMAHGYHDYTMPAPQEPIRSGKLGRFSRSKSAGRNR